MADERTEVLSLDELMDLASDRSSEQSTAPTVQIRRYGAPPAPPTPTPAPLNPATPRPVAPRAEAQHTVAVPDMGRLLDQIEEKFGVAFDTSREWLRRGDNGLIAGTALVALLLLVVVASL